MSQRRIVVYGASGHGKVVADIIRRVTPDFLGFVDDNAQLTGTRLLGFEVLGTGEWLRQAHERDAAGKGDTIEVVLGIGENAIRERVAARCLAWGMTLTTAVHPSAVIAASATLGEGTVVMAQAAVNPDVSIGRGVIVNTGATVEHDCVLGDWSHISPNAAMAGAARLGTRSQLGIGGVILPGITVGNDVTIGAGSVVNRAIGHGVVAYGVPAKVHRSREVS